MSNFLQKLIAFFFNSKFIIRNPYINFNAYNEYRRLTIFKKLVTMDTTSVFYPETIIYNNANDPSKIVIGKESHIQGELNVFKYGGQITIGDNAYIGKDSRIWSGESITIGNNVLISHFCNIIDTDSHETDAIERAERYKDLVKNGPWSTKGSIKSSPIVIHDHAWISFNVTILKGVTIGEGAIIGANSVVTKDVPEYCLAVGNPAQIVKKLK
jgi:acetyltransferase-like isoleucine patch superfamily enzyme